MRLDNDSKAFLELVRAGLWGKEVTLSQFSDFNFIKIYRLAEGQSVIGLVAAGLEHVSDIKLPQEDVLSLISSTIQTEQRNQSMNQFVSDLIVKLRAADVYSLLLKGQGIAQCYERPLWRSCGDIDLLLDERNYENAIDFLSALASNIDEEKTYYCHIAMTISSWVVELHGTLRGGLWKNVDRVLDGVQNDIFCNGAVRSWMNGDAQIFLPRADEDVVFVFSHILQHFFKGGIGLRQICDWCRLLWTYSNKINREILERRLRKMRACTEWKAFAYLAVNTLGMPADEMPFYSFDKKWKRKAGLVLRTILRAGNFGHNKDYTYFHKYPTLIRKIITLWRQTKESIRLLYIFPLDSIRFYPRFVIFGIKRINKK